MTLANAFQIATKAGSLATLASLGLDDPKPSYAPEAVRERTLGGGLRSLGAPIATWTWSFIPNADKELLRAYCAGASAEVKIETTDNHGVFHQYSAWVYWPEGPEKEDATRRLDFVLEFRYLVLSL